MSIWNRAYLKSMTDKDLDLVLSWRNQDFVRNMMYSSEIISKEEHVAWFEKIQTDTKSEAKVFYFDGKPYGVVNIHEINYLNGTCEWSFYIGEKNAPPGIGAILGCLAVDYIFNDLCLRKLCAEVMEFNYKSLHFHRKLGFQQEGILEEHVKKQGEFVDVYLLRLFKSEWLKQSNQIKKNTEQKFKSN